MACTYIYQGKKHTAWEFADVLAAMPPAELTKYLPAKARSDLLAIYGQENQLPEKIEVDGILRSTLNSSGKPIYPTEEGVRNFWRWFGDSRVTDAEGRPLVMYHGTSSDKDFSRFKVGKRGAWFTSNQEVASEYAEQNDNQKDKYNPETRRYDKVNYAGRVMPVYLKVENPYKLTNEDRFKVNVGNYAKAQRELFSRIDGSDGILWNDALSKEWVVLDEPTQIKSAIGNNGDFSLANQDIRHNISEDDAFVSDFLTELSFEDAAFRYAISPSKTLEGNILAALPGAEYLGEDTRPDEREESQADRRFVFAMPNEMLFYVYTRGNDVWIDVSRLRQGDRGSAVYHGVANYAFNTGKVFVGDPNGLSEDAVIRRTSSMLSSALRFGTTRHIAPAVEQLRGATEKGIAKLEWKEGDDVANLKYLAHTYISTLHNLFPGIESYRYDFDRLQFVDSRGRPVDAARLERAEGSPAARASRTGEASLRRGILIQSLISSESSERPGLLEIVLGRSMELASKEGGLKAVFSRADTGAKTQNDQSIFDMVAEGRKAADVLERIAKFGSTPFNRQLAKLLLKTGISPKVIISTPPAGSVGNKNVSASYSQATDTIALMRPAQAERDMLHEMIHAATLQALERGGVAASQMRVLFNHVNRSGKLEGMYGMTDVDEFVAEAFTNPRFQEALRNIDGPKLNGKPQSAWDWFVSAVRSILGLAKGEENALSQAIEIGLGVMQENHGLEAFKQSPGADLEFANTERAYGGREAYDRAKANGKTKLNYRQWVQVRTPAFKAWFGDWENDPENVSKVVDPETGEPLVVYHGTMTPENFQAFKTESGAFNVGAHFGTREQAEELIRSTQHMLERVKARNGGTIPANYLKKYGGEPRIIEAFLSIKNPARTADLGDEFAWDRAIGQAKADNLDGIIYQNTEEGDGDSFIAFAPTQIKSATGNNGDFDRANPDIRYNIAEEGWRAPEMSKMDDLIHALQDKQVDLKRVTEEIRKSGQQVTDDIDPYLQEELFYGRAAKGVKDFLDFELRPLLKAMEDSGVDMGDFEEYLWMRHAKERNEQIAKVNKDMPDGGSGVTTDEAKTYLAGLGDERRKTLDALAARIDQINRENQRVLVESGLENQSTIDAWNGAYEHYVPLQREDVESGHVGTGKGFSIRGSSTKRAMGSGKPVVDIIANLTMQRERNIVRAEKNRVSQSMLGLAQQSPNPDFWKVDTAPTERVVQEKAIYYVVDADGERTGEEFTRMDEADRRSRAIGGSVEQTWEDRVVERIVPGFQSRDNVLLTRIDGKDHYIIFNERNERAIRMAMSMKNLDVDNMGKVLSVVGKATRYLASVNTQYNPVFGIVNIVRDVQGALINLQSTPLAGKQKQVLADTLSALRGIYTDIRAHRKGQRPSSEWAELFDEFQKEGGQTGYRDQFANAEQRAEAIVDELKQAGEGGFKRGARAAFGWLSDYNEAMENAVRLAAYKAAKEQGMSNQQAASLAKNITVNFNRKGSSTTQIGALYAFFNASVQGTARIAETLFERTGGNRFKLSKLGRRVVMGGIALGALQALALFAAGYDEDEPPPFVRERSLVIPVGGGKYISIPMPLGFHVLPGIGRIFTEFALSGGKDPAKRTVEMLGLFAESFNPVGSSGFSIQTLTPSVIDPFAALAENRDFTGRDIYRENFNTNDPTPGHTRAKDVATAWSRMISEGINFATGGTEFKPGAFSPSPDAIDYLIAQATGGVGREVNKVAQTIQATASNDDLPLYKVPVVGRFVGDTQSQSGETQKLYNTLREVNMHNRQIKGLRDEGRAEEAQAYMAENPDYRLIQSAKSLDTRLRKLRSARREAIASSNDERVRQINEQIVTLVSGFNEKAAALRE